ncbi:MAG: amidase [Hydrogenophaga sp.]|uniref:amidase n=1 Tax=Hydrogenophaga sp. TaxID=1904254 RepID=UPI001D9F2731|nr:amidase [Hydrogenophaga sp.]MBX3611597.1 amidase [Hydrogenophaga sp.]
MTTRHCHEIGASELVADLNAGRMALKDYLDAMTQYHQAVEPQVHAFAHQDPAIVRPQVERLDALRQMGLPLPPLYGVPIGIKDNIDTADYPTELGFEGAMGRTPSVDAFLVHRLRQAGAIIWGKTRSTELAYMTPTITTNPRVPGHTPGGSSSGSAAAVASGQVPVAVGTQTNGSVIRPASFCGVFGYKPSRGLIFNGGVLPCAPSLDQVGVFARQVEDLADVAEAMIGGHERSDGALVFPMRLGEVCRTEPPLPPKLMFARTPQWERMDPTAQAAFEELIDELKDCMVVVDLHASVANAWGWHKTVMEAEMAHHLQPWVETVGGKVGEPISALMERSRAITGPDYVMARERMQRAATSLDEYFDHFDAIVTPATLGAAPSGLQSTGDPSMCTLWTFAGLPCVSCPWLGDDQGRPIGVQLVGAPKGDARLLRTARWLHPRLQAAAH